MSRLSQVLLFMIQVFYFTLLVGYPLHIQGVKVYYLFSKNKNIPARLVVIGLCPLTLSNYIM